MDTLPDSAAHHHPNRHERLRQAVLDDALHVFHRYATSTTPAGQRLFEEIAGWFASDDRRWPFSFLPICAELGLDPESIRAELHAWRASGHQVPLIEGGEAGLSS